MKAALLLTLMFLFFGFGCTSAKFDRDRVLQDVAAFLDCRYSEEDLRRLGYDSREDCRELHQALWEQKLGNCADKMVSTELDADQNQRLIVWCIDNWLNELWLEIGRELMIARNRVSE